MQMISALEKKMPCVGHTPQKAANVIGVFGASGAYFYQLTHDIVQNQSLLLESNCHKSLQLFRMKKKT